MHILNIVTSPRKEQSASRALVDTFLPIHDASR
jgi:FMN-dependent NADH-azoreductase